MPRKTKAQVKDYEENIDRLWDEAREAGTVSDERYIERLEGLAKDAENEAEVAAAKVKAKKPKRK